MGILDWLFRPKPQNKEIQHITKEQRKEDDENKDFQIEEITDANKTYKTKVTRLLPDLNSEDYEITEQQIDAECVSSDTIDEDEKDFYHSDDYYTTELYPGSSLFNRQVIPFENWKDISFPSKNGLYVPEIYLLHYCNKGIFPKPKNGYQGFWWFIYGIRDVGSVLKSLEARGFIEWATSKEALKGLTTPEIKEIVKPLKKVKLSQKKEDLLKDIDENISEDELPIIEKYKLTELGKKELEENDYVIKYGSGLYVLYFNWKKYGGETEEMSIALKKYNQDIPTSPGRGDLLG